MRRLTSQNQRPGAVTVEMALLIGISMVIMLSSIELARCQMITHATQNAAYEAARYAILPGANATDAENKALSYLNVHRINHGVVTVTPAHLDEDTQEVTIQVRVPAAGNSWVRPYFSAGKQITGSATLRAERFRTTN